MRSVQIVFLTMLAAVFVAVGFLTLQGSRMMWGELNEVKSVPSGSHEIAFIASPTGFETWQRIVESAELLEKQWSSYTNGRGQLELHKDNAYPSQSAGVPEIELWLQGNADSKILLRWYKAGEENSCREWIDKLTKRRPPPLAIIGGQSTREAKWISDALKDVRRNNSDDPVFLITTATADAVSPPPDAKAKAQKDRNFTHDDAPLLMNIYKNRNFRFSFSNTLMAEAVLDFVQEQPDLWSPRDFSPVAAAGAIAAADPITAAMVLRAENNQLDYAMFTVDWEDDKYSIDLSDRFLEIFQERFYPSEKSGKRSDPMDMNQFFADDIKYSRLGRDRVHPAIGDPFKPNVHERWAIPTYLTTTDQSPRIRQLLVLPTSAQRAGRYLRALRETSPQALHNVVVLSGDSISFNNVYRDRKVMWDIRDFPVPLVTFSHRNPVEDDAGFAEEDQGKHPWSVTGTQDLLFYRDVLEAVVEAGWEKDQLVDNAEEFDRAMQQLYWNGKRITRNESNGNKLFEGRNRRTGSGEHLICVVPERRTGNIDFSTVTVWSRSMKADRSISWRRVRVLADVRYSELDSSRLPGPEDFLRLP